MQKMKFAQAVVALAVVAGGALFAKEGLAIYSCSASNQLWTNYYGACYGMADIQAGDRGLSTAYVAANCLTNAPFVCSYAGVVALDSNGNAISGCKAEDFTADGNSVSDTSGCQNGRTLTYVVEYDWD